MRTSLRGRRGGFTATVDRRPGLHTLLSKRRSVVLLILTLGLLWCHYFSQCLGLLITFITSPEYFMLFKVLYDNKDTFYSWRTY